MRMRWSRCSSASRPGLAVLLFILTDCRRFAPSDSLKSPRRVKESVAMRQLRELPVAPQLCAQPTTGLPSQPRQWGACSALRRRRAGAA